ncbi:MAG TPA: metal ABC transporter permease, partial [Beutenbergiaceae bacterium]|nr:metal ABC transporter permease [Beutenbergiaceae bacterium]
MSFIDIIQSPLAQRALVIAVLVGAVTPIIGTYLVQRRLSLLGDGIGHVALTGVGAGWLVGTITGAAQADAYAVPGAVVAAVLGAIAIEYMRHSGRTSGDVALALLFYGGIAGGVLIMSLAGGTSANLTGYLFGSLATVSAVDVWMTLGLAIVIVVVGFRLRSVLFAVNYNEEFARASGLPATALNVVTAVIAALTVTVSMRVVGLLLV